MSKPKTNTVRITLDQDICDRIDGAGELVEGGRDAVRRMVEKEVNTELRGGMLEETVIAIAKQEVDAAQAKLKQLQDALNREKQETAAKQS